MTKRKSKSCGDGARGMEEVFFFFEYFGSNEQCKVIGNLKWKRNFDQWTLTVTFKKISPPVHSTLGWWERPFLATFKWGEPCSDVIAPYKTLHS